MEEQPEEPPFDVVGNAYAKWHSLPPDMRGAILHDLVMYSSQNKRDAEAFELAGGLVRDVAAQGERRRLFANAYEWAFMILAHAGEHVVGVETRPA